MEKYCYVYTTAVYDSGSYSYFAEIAKFLSAIGSEESNARVLLGMFLFDIIFSFSLLILFGDRLVMAGVDATVWPSNASYMTAILNDLNSLLVLSPLHAAYLQFPVVHGQTTVKAKCKHWRSIEDSLINNGLDFSTSVALTFEANDQHQGDKRALMHPGAFVTGSQDGNFWQQSAPCLCSRIGPCRLIRVQDMVGYDSETRPGAAARLEQNLSRNSLSSSCFLGNLF